MLLRTTTSSIWKRVADLAAHSLLQRELLSAFVAMADPCLFLSHFFSMVSADRSDVGLAVPFTLVGLRYSRSQVSFSVYAILQPGLAVGNVDV